MWYQGKIKYLRDARQGSSELGYTEAPKSLRPCKWQKNFQGKSVLGARSSLCSHITMELRYVKHEGLSFQWKFSSIKKVGNWGD